MIAEIYIESAISIRNEFVKLTNTLDGYQQEMANLVIYLESKISELLSYSDTHVSKIKNKNDIAKAGEDIIKKINEIEAEEERIIKLIKPINDKIEKLNKDEEFLYDQIVQKYPNLTKKQIIEEIHSHL
jgi:ribosomal protein S1